MYNIFIIFSEEGEKMKKLLLLLAILSALIMSSCSSGDTGPSAGAPGGPIDPGYSYPPSDSHEREPENIMNPPFSDIGKNLVSFDDFEYIRPDTDALVSELARLSSDVTARVLSYDELIDRILSVDEMYDSFDTMTAYISLMSSAEITDTSLSEEYEFLTSESAVISRAIEEMLVVLANSEFADRLEKEAFGEGFVDRYKDGSKYNSYTVYLLQEEALLESKYFALSPKTIIITYEGRRDTYENTLARIEVKYKDDPEKYQKALADCEALFISEYDKFSTDIYIELLKIRRLIAETFGYNSYAEYAYEQLGHDYSPEDMDELLNDIANYAVPVYTSLNSRAFAGFFKMNKAPVIDTGSAVNTIFRTLKLLDPDIADVYAYMLNCGLYDIAPESDTRRDGAFTVYLKTPDVPVIFATLNGNVNDCMTLAHEFGHFYDNIKNDGIMESLDLSEVASQSLEFLLMTKISKYVTESEYKYIYYSQMRSALETLIFQGFYAKFEALAYELPYKEITRANLNALVKTAAAEMKLNTEYLSDISDIVIVHLIDTPFYVQSYCTSVLASLDIYFAECATEGKGVAAYNALIEHEEGTGFVMALKNAGVPTPFRAHAVKSILDKVYLSIIGSHYFEDNRNEDSAAVIRTK